MIHDRIGRFHTEAVTNIIVVNSMFFTSFLKITILEELPLF